MNNLSLFQKHVCILFMSVGLITLYISMKEPMLIPNKKPFSIRNETVSPQNVDYGGSISSSENISEIVSLLSLTDEWNSTLSKKKVVNILGLFELSTKWGEREEGKSELLAAKIAIQHINEMGVLPGYTLKLLVNDTRIFSAEKNQFHFGDFKIDLLVRDEDSVEFLHLVASYDFRFSVNEPTRISKKCDPGIGVDRFFHALYSNKNILVLLGSSCSNVTERLAHIMPYWNIPQISFGSTSPNLSDRRKFPLFFRTIPPDSSHNSAKIQFLKHFGWEIVIAFTQSENAFLLPINNLVKELEIANISCKATITFSIENYKEQMRTLKILIRNINIQWRKRTLVFIELFKKCTSQDLDVRVILGSFSSELATAVFCEAFQLQMHREDYVWILQDHQDSRWNSLPRIESCKVEQLKQATEGLILVSDVNEIVDNETSAYGLVGGGKSKVPRYAIKVNLSVQYSSESHICTQDVALD